MELRQVNFAELEPLSIALEFVSDEFASELTGIREAIAKYRKSKNTLDRLRVVQLQQQLFFKMAPASLTDRSKPPFSEQACVLLMQQLWVTEILGGKK